MGRAYAATGDFMNVEDRCALRKSVYSWETPQESPHTAQSESPEEGIG